MLASVVIDPRTEIHPDDPVSFRDRLGENYGVPDPTALADLGPHSRVAVSLVPADLRHARITKIGRMAKSRPHERR